MKVKRQKQVRKTVRFYKVCFGFKEPYKVLLDGNFIHQSVNSQAAGQGGIRNVLHKFFGGAVKPMVTRCISTELRALGPQFAKSSSAARTLDMARCTHETPVPATECMLSMVGQHNEEHFFIASQDVELRKRLRTVPGAALLFLSTAGLILEPPSETQQNFAKLSEAERLHLNEQRAALRQLEKSLAAASPEADDPAAEAPQPEQVTSNGQETIPGPRKRKRVKGPNPLSMKKKKSDDSKTGSSKEVQSTGAVARPRKRSRQRHRKASSADS